MQDGLEVQQMMDSTHKDKSVKMRRAEQELKKCMGTDQFKEKVLKSK